MRKAKAILFSAILLIAGAFVGSSLPANYGYGNSFYGSYRGCTNCNTCPFAGGGYFFSYPYNYNHYNYGCYGYGK